MIFNMKNTQKYPTQMLLVD